MAYLKQFWADRDRTELRGDGERLREHYRRLFYARKNFQLTSLNRHYDIVERYRSGSRDFDDRGVIYIRHGEPTSRATYAAPGLEPNESWRYTRPEGDLLFHFVAREDVQDFKLVESLFDVLGFSQQIALRGDQARRQPGRRAAHAARASSCRRSTSGCSRPGASAAASIRPRSGGWGRRASRSGPAPTATSSPSREELKVRSEVLAVGPGLERDAGADRLCHLGQGPRAGDGDARLSLLGPGPVRGDGSDRPGRGLARHDAALRRARAGARRRAPGRTCRRAGADRASYEYRLAIQQGEEAGVVLPRDTRARGRHHVGRPRR